MCQWREQGGGKDKLIPLCMLMGSFKGSGSNAGGESAMA